MAFHEDRFPEDISFGSFGGPEFSTDIVVMASGYEQRNQNWSRARGRYNVSHGVRSQTQLDALIAFFRARKGRAHGFRFKDWTDYAATNQVIGVGDDSTVAFQLVKTYTSGSEMDTRTITKPVSGTVKIYVNSVEQMSGVSLDHTTGMMIFDTAPTSLETITADFEFDVPVRFDTDQVSAILEEYGIFSMRDVPLMEIRV